MAIVSVKNLELGSILNADVKDIKGRMLMSSGTEISARTLQILKAWGITEVSIAGEAHDEEHSAVDLAAIDPELERQINRQIGQHFILCDKDHPAIQEIINHIKLSKFKHLYSEPSN